jgi:biopolymer transport protein ExbD
MPEIDPEFQIAPMIDILLVLLVFFMSIASTEVLQSNDQVKLPIAKDAKDKEKSVKNGQSIINVLWNPLNNVGTIEVDEQKFPTPADIQPVLQKKLTANPDMRVLVRADKNVRYEYLRTLMVAAAGAGVTNLTFSVVDKDQAQPAPSNP